MAMSKEEKRVRAHVGRARRAGLLATLTLHEWLAILDHFQWKCAYCGRPFEVMEHIEPIGEGGGTTAKNVVPACITCNCRKDGHVCSYPLAPDAIERVKLELWALSVEPGALIVRDSETMGVL